MQEPRETVLTPLERILAPSTRTDEGSSTPDVGGDLKQDEKPLPRPFGRYELRRLLGSGAMGSVYLAHDGQLDRLVALKLPRASGDEATWRARFFTEAKAAAGIHHPNVCPLHDLGEVEGKPYLTMPFVEGETLAARLEREGPMEPAAARRLVATVARAIAAAHERGVVHRDLKPANIMLDRDGRVLVMDFGLAMRSTRDDQRLTRSGAVLGTPAYMSPEQINGETDAIGPSTDIYSLGVLLFECLTGRVPFLSKSFGTLAAQISRDPPPAPSSLNSAVEPLSDDLTLRAMSKLPAGRFPSAVEFAEALEGSSSGDAASLPPAPPREGEKPTRLPSRLNRRLKWSFAVFSVSIALLSFALMHGGPDDQPKNPDPTDDQVAHSGWLLKNLWIALEGAKREPAPPVPAPPPRDFFVDKERIDKAAKRIAEAKGDPGRLVEAAQMALRLTAELPIEERAFAEERLFRPLAGALFPIRAELNATGRHVLDDVLFAARSLEEYRIAWDAETAPNVVDLARARAIADANGSPRNAAVLGIAEAHASRKLKGAERIDLLTKGAQHLEAAVGKLSASDPDRYIDTARREAVAALFELANAHVAMGRKESIAFLDRAEALAKGQPEHAATLRSIRLARGRGLWEFTRDTGERKGLDQARADLAALTADRNAPEAVEATYWLVLIELYRGDAIRARDPASNYESDKARIVSTRLPRANVELLRAWDLLREPSQPKTPYGVELLEWRACLACAIANEENEAGSGAFVDAMKAVELLQRTDPLCATTRRLQFLCGRATTAGAREGAEAKELQSLWEPAAKVLARLPDAPRLAERLPGTPDRDRRLFDCAVALAQANAASIPELKRSPSPTEVDVCLEIIRKLGLPASTTAPPIEDLALRAAVLATKALQDGNRELQDSAAATALSAFRTVRTLDPKLEVVLRDESALVSAGAFRAFVAVLMERGIKIKPENLKNSPDTVDLLIRIDNVLADAETILRKAAGSETAKSRLAVTVTNRADLKSIWFDKHLDDAIDAAKSRGEAARANAWSDYKSKRDEKP